MTSLFFFYFSQKTDCCLTHSKATDSRNSLRSQSKSDLGLSRAPCQPTWTCHALGQQSTAELFPAPLRGTACKRATAERKMWFWHPRTRKGVKAGQDTQAREKAKGRAGGPGNTREVTPARKHHREKTNSPLLSNSSSNTFPKTLWVLWYGLVWSIIMKIS